MDANYLRAVLAKTKTAGKFLGAGIAGAGGLGVAFAALDATPAAACSWTNRDFTPFTSIQTTYCGKIGGYPAANYVKVAGWWWNGSEYKEGTRGFVQLYPYTWYPSLVTGIPATAGFAEGSRSFGGAWSW
jgi:hypothetical protein